MSFCLITFQAGYSGDACENENDDDIENLEIDEYRFSNDNDEIDCIDNLTNNEEEDSTESDVNEEDDLIEEEDDDDSSSYDEGEDVHEESGTEEEDDRSAEEVRFMAGFVVSSIDHGGR